MNKINNVVTVLILLLIGTMSKAQSYEVQLSPIEIEGLGGLQSYAVGTHNGEWLIVGGRLDGLHRRQPFASFSPDGKNQDLIVVNPKDNTVWRSPLASLPTGIAEQLSSTNIQFYQDGDKLLCTGGYAFSPTQNNHITFPYLTIIDIPAAIASVKDNSLSASSFVQIENEMFRVTGGALNKIDDVYHLVGGHKFMGRYNPMGPDHGPGFEQEYTNEIRKFKLTGDNGNFAVEDLVFHHDELHLHRRDYNLAPYLDEGDRNLMIYSGVFRNTADVPWLYPVSINNDDYVPLENFTQYYNHYHCAFLPIYDSSNEEMHTLFFGGIAQYYEDNGMLVQDNDIPFVNTIADVSRNQNGELSETKLTAEMPGYLGAGSVFILNEDAPLADDDIVDGSMISEEFMDIGYIYGGIRSSLPNIFWINTGIESEASKTIYKVAIKKVDTTNSLSTVSQRDFLEFYPNPANRIIRMAIEISQPSDLNITISDTMGRQIHQQSIPKSELTIGKNILKLENINIGYGAFIYTVSSNTSTTTRKVIWTE